MVFPSHQFNPEDWMGFVEMRPFTSVWKKLGLSDEDLFAVQLAIMADPRGSPVIPGTGGVRKLRFSPINSDKGKSGTLRVCYAVLEEHERVVLVLVYPKSFKDDLTEQEKMSMKRAIEQIKKELDH